MTDPGQPADPVLRAIAGYWDDIQRLAGPGQRARLAALLDGTAEPDPDEARAALADALIDILPPDHPLSQLLQTGTLYRGELSEQTEAELADELRRLGRLVLLGHEPDEPAAPAPSPAGPTVTDAAAVTGPPVSDFDRQVQARLLALPSVSADDPRNGRADHRGLIRLPRPDGGGQLPAFQFGPSGGPWPIVSEINRLLDAAADPWGVTCWWVDPHALLDAAPADLLGRGNDDLLRLAANRVGEDY